MLVAVLLELHYCIDQVSHLPSPIPRLFVPPLSVGVTFLIHLKDKHTPESIDAHSLTQTYPFLVTL